MELNIMEYVKPELLALVAAMVVLGKVLKVSKVRDRGIPSILMASSIVLATIWVLATSGFANAEEISLGIFTGIVQGILCAGTGIGLHQTFVAQPNREE